MINTEDSSIYFDVNNISSQHQRNLPHWFQRGAVYFVTFRLNDSLPDHTLRNIYKERDDWRAKYKINTDKELHQLNRELIIEYYRLFSKRIDEILDQGIGACLLKNSENSLVVKNALLHFHGIRYLLDHWVVMPNHVHVLVQPIKEWTLTKITHSWKSFSANEINKLQNRTGALWQTESFDHIVRNSTQLDRIRQYILSNPKNLPTSHYRIGIGKDVTHPR